MNRVEFAGGWYVSATRTDHAVLYPDKKIGTSRGDVPLPSGGNVLHLDCANIKDTFCIAGQGHQDGLAWLWNGTFWTSLVMTYGTSTCKFGPLGLYVSTPAASDNIRIYDVETLKLLATLTKVVGVRGIASVTGAGINPSDVHSVDEWYNTVSGLAECVHLDGQLAAGQGVNGGLCARDGNAYAEVEPGSVQFVRATLDGTIITTAAWKDQEAKAVVIRMERAELTTPPTPGPTMIEFFLHPNIAVPDLMALIDRPDLLANIPVLGLYVQEVIFEDPPNSSSALIAADVYRKLAAAGVQLNLEIGSVKGGDCDCKNALHNLEWAVGVVRDHGGDVAYLSQDEPLTAWMDSCSKLPDKRSIDQIADSVATWMTRATELGVKHVGWIEAWPHVGFAVMQQFLDLLAARGVKPSHWHLDIDWKTAESQGKNVPAFIHAASELAKARSITLGLLVNTTVDPIPTDAKHFANLADLSRKIKGIEANPARVVVQSWARRINGGPQTVPNNLGISGLVASLADTMTVFGAAPPKPDPIPPPEGHEMLSTFTDPTKETIAVKEIKPVAGSKSVTWILPNGNVYSCQPGGAFGERPPGTAGPWEKNRTVGNVGTFNIDGKFYTKAYVLVDGL